MTRTGEVVALVPVRGLRGGKTRLAGNLSAEARAALTARMLAGVVGAALDSGVVAAVGVVSPEEAALALAGTIDPAVVALRQDAARPGLNAALDRGRAWARERGATALLVLFGDLPLLAGGDVRRMVGSTAAVVLARDRHGTGTNGMLLRLDGAGREFRFRFGTDSYARHVAEARRLGLALAVADAPGTAVDLDTSEDLRLVLEVGEDGRGGDVHETLVAEGAGVGGGRPT